MREFLSHRLRAADDGVDAFLDLGPCTLLKQEQRPILDDGRGGLRRSIAGRREVDALEQIADEVPEVRLEFLARLRVSLGDVDWHAPAHLLRLRRVARFLKAVAAHRKNAAKNV